MARFLRSGMTPHAFVEPKEMVGRQRDDDRCCEKQRKVLPVVCGRPVAEIDDLCKSIARETISRQGTGTTGELVPGRRAPQR